MKVSAIIFNLLFIYNGTVMVGEVVKTSGNVVYVRPCGSTGIGNVQLNKRDVIHVKLSCKEFLEQYR